MAFLIKYQDDTNTYQIKHANACDLCKHKSGNSLAVMKVVLDDDGATDYSIKFKEILTIGQVKKLIPYVEEYIQDVIEAGR